MATIPFSVTGSNFTPPFTYSLKKTGDSLERLVSSAGGILTFTPDYGVNANYTARVTDSLGCDDTETFSLCCPAINGSLTGTLNPSPSSLRTYTVSGITGAYTEVGPNGGFFIVGGNATFVSTSGGVAQINVGTLAFQLCYRIRSCDIERDICINITPQSSCLLVSNIAVGCSVSNPVFRERFSLDVSGGSGLYEIRYQNPFNLAYSSWVSFSGGTYVDDNMPTTSGGTVPDQVIPLLATDERVKYTVEIRDRTNNSCNVIFEIDYLVDLPNDQIYAEAAKLNSLGFVHDSTANLIGVTPKSTNHDCDNPALSAATFVAYNRNGVKIGTLTTNSGGTIIGIAP